MRLVPKNNSKRLSFFQVRIRKWEENAGQIGVSEEQVAALAEKWETARVALLEQRKAQAAARSATQWANSAMQSLMTDGSTMIQQIRATAAVEGPKVYPLASLPRPKKGSPIAAPGQVTKVDFKLHPAGQLSLSWVCPNPRGSEGTMYILQRQLNGEGPFQYLATVGKKKYLDSTIPRGTKYAIYKIQSIRSTRTGTAAEFTVNLGYTSAPPALKAAA